MFDDICSWEKSVIDEFAIAMFDIEGYCDPTLYMATHFRV